MAEPPRKKKKKSPFDSGFLDEQEEEEDESPPPSHYDAKQMSNFKISVLTKGTAKNRREFEKLRDSWEKRRNRAGESKSYRLYTFSIPNGRYLNNGNVYHDRNGNISLVTQGFHVNEKFEFVNRLFPPDKRSETIVLNLMTNSGSRHKKNSMVFKDHHVFINEYFITVPHPFLNYALLGEASKREIKLLKMDSHGEYKLDNEPYQINQQDERPLEKIHSLFWYIPDNNMSDPGMIIALLDNSDEPFLSFEEEFGLGEIKLRVAFFAINSDEQIDEIAESEMFTVDFSEYLSPDRFDIDYFFAVILNVDKIECLMAIDICFACEDNISFVTMDLFETSLTPVETERLKQVPKIQVYPYLNPLDIRNQVLINRTTLSALMIDSNQQIIIYNLENQTRIQQLRFHEIAKRGRKLDCEYIVRSAPNFLQQQRVYLVRAPDSEDVNGVSRRVDREHKDRRTIIFEMVWDENGLHQLCEFVIRQRHPSKRIVLDMTVDVSGIFLMTMFWGAHITKNKVLFLNFDPLIHQEVKSRSRVIQTSNITDATSDILIQPSFDFSLKIDE